MTLLGSGTVVIGDRQKRFWDRVELLDGGVLRVASTARWNDPNYFSNKYVAEILVEYYAPGTWLSFVPEAERNGTLTVVVEGEDPRILGKCLTEHQVDQVAFNYLRENYRDTAEYADHLRQFFGPHLSDTWLYPHDTDDPVRVRFQWHLPQQA